MVCANVRNEVARCGRTPEMVKATCQRNAWIYVRRLPLQYLKWLLQDMSCEMVLRHYEAKRKCGFKHEDITCSAAHVRVKFE